MAKAKKRTVTTVEDIDEAGEPSAALGEDVTLLLGELVDGGGGTLKIERFVAGGLSFVDEWDAGAFTWKALQEACGGGKYRLTAKDAARRYTWSRTVTVDPPRVVPSAEPAALDKLTMALSAMMEQQQKMFTLLISRGQAPAVTSDQVRSQVLADLQAMRDIVGVGQGGGSDKMLDALRLGVELAREGAGGDADSVVPIIGKFLDKFGEPLAEAVSARLGALPAPATAAAANPAAPIQPTRGKQTMKMAQAVAFLVEKAAAGGNVDLYAELVLDNIPEAILRPILDGDVVARLAAVDPRVNNHAKWFSDLGAVLREALADDAAGTGSESAADQGGPGEPAAGT